MGTLGGGCGGERERERERETPQLDCRSSNMSPALCMKPAAWQVLGKDLLTQKEEEEQGGAFPGTCEHTRVQSQRGSPAITLTCSQPCRNSKAYQLTPTHRYTCLRGRYTHTGQRTRSRLSKKAGNGLFPVHFLHVAD